METGAEKTEARVERGALAEGRRRDLRPAIVLCLESTIVELSRDRETALLDRSNVAFLPAQCAHRLAAKSPTAATLTILIGEEARAMATKDYAPHVTAELYEALFTTSAILPRTRWLDEICQRYLFEREVCKKDASRAARFLESEIAKEIFFLMKERSHERTRASVVSGRSDLVQRAIALVEEDLFRPLKVGEIARACHASESTLLRAFRREVGVAPATYQRDRRLDEAMLLLRSHRFAVSEVATRVGYTNMAAFTSAFTKRFGAPPSQMKGEGDGLAVLPPHGMPPAAPRKRSAKARAATGSQR